MFLRSRFVLTNMRVNIFINNTFFIHSILKACLWLTLSFFIYLFISYSVYGIVIGWLCCGDADDDYGNDYDGIDIAVDGCVMRCVYAWTCVWCVVNSW